MSVDACKAQPCSPEQEAGRAAYKAQEEARYAQYRLLVENPPHHSAMTTAFSIVDDLAKRSDGLCYTWSALDRLYSWSGVVSSLQHLATEYKMYPKWYPSVLHWMMELRELARRIEAAMPKQESVSVQGAAATA